MFEAKIGFLMAVAATKQGAAELLDAGLFEIFAMCGFVAVQPTADDSMSMFVRLGGEGGIDR